MQREHIFEIAKVAGFERIETCCAGVPNKFCSADVWKGDLGALVAAIARAASANETGAKGADALAHEVWSAAQRAPGEGIEDAVQRIAAILSRSPAMAAEAAKPVAYLSTDPKLWDKCRIKQQGAFTVPVYAAPQPTAQADARVGLTEEQIIETFEREIQNDPDAYTRPDECVYQITAKELVRAARALLGDDRA